MPRIIDSLDPVVQAAVSAATYDKVEVCAVKYHKSEAGAVLKIGLCNADASGNIAPSGGGHNVAIKDTTAFMAQSPRLAAAWDAVVDIFGDIYVEKALEDKLREAQADDPEGDHSTLEADLAAAQATVRAAV